MPAEYAHPIIDNVPRSSDAAFQHHLDVYASEVNKLASVWLAFDDGVIAYKPHPKSTAVGDIFKHELLSARRFFGEFLGLHEPEAAAVLPPVITVDACVSRLKQCAAERLTQLAPQPRSWWDAQVKFFDVERSRTWVFWRRILHSAHHRTQLTVYLRLLDRPVPSIYGPTADVSWSGADPTRSVEAARRS